MGDDDDVRDILSPDRLSVWYRPVPGFPRYRIGSDQSVWKDRRRPGFDPRFAVERWDRVVPRGIFGSACHHVRLRHGGREHVRSIPLLLRAAFSPRPDLWLERIGPRPPRPAEMPRLRKPEPEAVAEAPRPIAVEPSPMSAPAPAPAPAPVQPAGPVELRVIPGFPFYAIGADRSVWSSYTSGRGVPDPAAPPSWRRKTLLNDGRSVGLWHDGKKFRRAVDDLYRSAFGHGPADAPEVLQAEGRFVNLQIGSENGRSQLDEAKVMEARKLRRQGWIYADLAERYGVTAGTMLAACSGKTWRHVPIGEKPG